MFLLFYGSNYYPLEEANDLQGVFQQGEVAIMEGEKFLKDKGCYAWAHVYRIEQEKTFLIWEKEIGAG